MANYSTVSFSLATNSNYPSASASWEVVLTYSRRPGEVLTEDVRLERKQAGESPWPKPR